MNRLQFKLTQFKLVELNDREYRSIFGGDKLSEDVFYFFGVAFKYLREASERGAPPTGQQFR